MSRPRPRNGSPAAGVPASAAGPTLRQLEVFRCTMQFGSASAAARALHVSQPAVTQTLQQMEAACGLRLFERRRGRLAATPEAQALLFELEKVQLGLEHVRQQIEALRSHGPVQLRFGCLHALSGGLVPRALARLRARRPQLRVMLAVDSSRAIRDAVASGALDLGIVADEADTAGLGASLFYELDAVALLPAAHPLARRESVGPEQLAGLPLVGLSASDRAQQRLVALFANAGVTPNIVIETPYSATQCALVAAGAGVALVNPVVARERALPGLAIVPFLPRLSFRALLVSHPSRPMAAAVRELAAELRTGLGDMGLSST